MKIYSASETEIDRRWALDKRKSTEAFCRGFKPKSEPEIVPNFCDLQDKIRDGLEKEFFGKFDDQIGRTQMESRRLSGSHAFFHFPAELISSERIIVELISEILDDRLLGVILAYLEKCQFPCCVIAAVFSGRKIIGKNYLGRFVVNLEEIAVEESLVKTWTETVRFLEIEATS